jgi:hypothetical protein
VRQDLATTMFAAVIGIVMAKQALRYFVSTICSMVRGRKRRWGGEGGILVSSETRETILFGKSSPAISLFLKYSITYQIAL